MLDYPLADIIDLMRGHLDHTRREKRQQKIKGPKTPTGTHAQRVIYRQADDSWF